MRTVHNWEKQYETWESQQKAGRYNPGYEITFRDKRGKHTVPIGAGSNDSVYVLREGEETYIVTINTRLDYVGLEIFDGDNSHGDMFCQGEQCNETVGYNWDTLTPITIAKRLSAYIY